jgi:hypothetical protein
VLFILREEHKLWTFGNRAVRKGMNLLQKKYQEIIRVFCDITSSKGEQFPALRKSLTAQISVSDSLLFLNCLTLRMVVLLYSESPVTTYRSTCHDFPDDLNFRHPKTCKERRLAKPEEGPPKFNTSLNIIVGN